MGKINSINDLNKLMEEAVERLGVRLHSNIDTNKKDVLVCGGTGCKSSGCQKIVDTLHKKIEENGLQDEINVVVTGCVGFCEQGPLLKITPDDAFYVKLEEKDVEEIFDKHLVKGEIVERALFKDPQTNEPIKKQSEMNFYKYQTRIALDGCGVVDPEKIEDYIGISGYQALYKVINNMSKDDVIEELIKSGLRGRGGGGFPTGTKWSFAKATPSEQKYIICNADEGDPGAFMDRSILESNPHSVVEAMAIAGYVIGADTGVVYIRAEYPLAVQRLNIAIEEAKELGLLGKNVFGSGFNFDIKVNLGAGAFVCGEETALMHSAEGERGEPTLKPPFPAVKGYWEKPTLINNVETFANIPHIINKGAEWFTTIGTEKSKGTKVFALAGKINNVGLVEIPMGTKLRDVIYNIGGGIRDGKKFKAVQTGGPSGGCVYYNNLDMEIDYDSLTQIGSMMGSGGMIVLDEDDCMVNISKFYLDFTVEESCGKCTPCRVGNTRLSEILDKITQGLGEESDLDNLKELGEMIKVCSLCGLGQTAPNPVLSTMEFFYDEYKAHIVDKKCPAGACKDLLQYNVIPEKCIGCTICAKNCPASCISGKLKEVHEIDQNSCVKCGICLSKCPKDAIERV